MKIHSAFTAPAYRQCENEEGRYDAFVGYNVFAETTGPLIEYHGYTGGEPGLKVFDLAAAEQLAERVKAAGSIRPELWEHVGNADCSELPDYVLNPWRPEYN